MAVLSLYFKALLKHWWALMSSALFTILGIVVLYFQRSNAWTLKTSFGLSGLCLLLACFLAWLDEHRKYIGELKRNEHPEIKGRVLVAYWETPENSIGNPIFRDSQYYVKLELVNLRDVPCTISQYWMCSTDQKAESQGYPHLSGTIKHHSGYRDKLTTNDPLEGSSTHVMPVQINSQYPLTRACAQEAWVSFYVKDHIPIFRNDGPDWIQEHLKFFVIDSLGSSHMIEEQFANVFKGHLDKA